MEPTTYNSSTGQVTFEGRTATIGGLQGVSHEAMRAMAADEKARAERKLRHGINSEGAFSPSEVLYRARRLLAVADLIEAEQATEKARKAAQRKAKAAATRAHNKDPFGFRNR